MPVSHEHLALHGGSPVRATPLPPMFPGGMLIGDEEKQAVLAVLEDKNLFRFYGPSPSPSRVAAFEQQFARHMGARYALAVTSGTAALHTGLVALGIGGSVVVTFHTQCSSLSMVSPSGR